MLCMDISELSPTAKLEQLIVHSNKWLSWDIIAPTFINRKWRTSKYTRKHDKLLQTIKRLHTNFGGCVPLKKKLAITLWKLATDWVQKHRSSFRSAQNNCVLVCARILHCCRGVVCTGTNLFPRPGEVWRNGCIHWEQVEASAVYWFLLMDHTCPCWHHRSTAATTSTVKAGTPSSFDVLWIERDFFGTCLQDCLGACIMLGFWDRPHCGSWPAMATTSQLTPGTSVGWMLATTS